MDAKLNFEIGFSLEVSSSKSLKEIEAHIRGILGEKAKSIVNDIYRNYHDTGISIESLSSSYKING